MMTHVREEDVPLLKVSREIPVWSLVTGIGLIILQAAGMFFTQLDHGKTLIKLEDRVTTLTAEITKTNMKTVEYDFRLGDIDRRLSRMEAQMAATNAANIQANTTDRMKSSR